MRYFKIIRGAGHFTQGQKPDMRTIVQVKVDFHDDFKDMGTETRGFSRFILCFSLIPLLKVPSTPLDVKKRMKIVSIRLKEKLEVLQ